MSDQVFCFGPCELRVDARELRVDGQAVALEPLAFNLLVYLLRHRDRTVSKDELLDQVWLGRIVSVGSLTRAVMMVRRAIGDVGEAPLIRTEHRVGYRFAGEVDERAAPAPAAPQQVAGPAISVALLPFENLTGELSLDWTTLGLMALVGNALAIDARLAPLSVHALATTLRGLPHDADIEQRADALRRHDGVQHVVHTRILRGERGYRLDYRLVTAARDSVASVHADTPIRLGRALARRLLGRLLPGEPSTVDGFVTQDAWALEVFGRAMQASAEQNRVRAAHLLRVVLDIAPEYAEARLELQRVEAGDFRIGATATAA
ncbi:MAG: winged helix-turn-helix domain-containing protein [Burkholderiales bacterium]